MNDEKSGWIKLHRQALTGGWLQSPNLWTFWCYCLLKANHESGKEMVKFQRINITPGQFVFGRKKASEELKMSQQSIRTCLKKLQLLGNITLKSTNKFSILTICNWEHYQGSKNKSNQQVTSNQPASNQQVTTNKNDKNERMKEKKKRSVSKKPKRVKSSWKNSPTEMNCGQFVAKMMESSQRHVQIIGHLADEMKPGLETKGQWQVFFDRYKKRGFYFGAVH